MGGLIISKDMQKILLGVNVSPELTQPLLSLKQISSKLLNKVIYTYVKSRNKLGIHSSNPAIVDALNRLETMEKESKKLPEIAILIQPLTQKL